MATGEKGLDRDAIGFGDGPACALASTAPVIGAVLLGYPFSEALVDYADPANSYTGSSWLGIAPAGPLETPSPSARLEPAPARAE